MDAPELTVLMPCLNEAATLPTCIEKALDSFRRLGIRGEVLVADNGSTDGSQDVARSHGARVVDVPVRGYGSALAAGIAEARSEWVIMGDADDSYDFSALAEFVDGLRAGNELVLGNRFFGGIRPGAMPFLHQRVGNPILTFVRPTNGPASSELAAAVQRDLLDKRPYAGEHMTVDRFFAAGSDREWGDLVVLADRDWGWSNNYSILRRAGIEAVEKHPKLYVRDVVAGVWDEVSQPCGASRPPRQPPPTRRRRSRRRRSCRTPTPAATSGGSSRGRRESVRRRHPWRGSRTASTRCTRRR